MHILIVLTYFQPYKSGLTVYAVRQAQALASRGHQVTVLTSQYDRALPLDEVVDGVHIVRLPVAFRLSKGVIMPQMPIMAWQLIDDSDIVNLHVPQFDSALLAVIAKMRHKPIVLTYHCDLEMPKGWINKLAGWASNVANSVSAKQADAIVHNTRDFAEHSSFLKKYLDKLSVIQPPIMVETVTEEDVQQFREKYNIQPGQRVVGMVARLATEKGVEYLVQAMTDVVQAIPDARTVFVGEYQHVLGEEAYQQRLLPMIDELGDRWTFLGVISELEKAVFFRVCDVLILPSINSTESFGMVQVEAMTCGTPVIATDMPGVRQPVQSTGMGEIVPPRDAEALAKAIIRVLRSGKDGLFAGTEALVIFYAPETVAKAYETLFVELLEENG